MNKLIIFDLIFVNFKAFHLLSLFIYLVPLSGRGINTIKYYWIIFHFSEEKYELFVLALEES